MTEDHLARTVSLKLRQRDTASKLLRAALDYLLYARALQTL